MQKIKLIAIDLDGTALDEKSHLTERTRRALEAGGAERNLSGGGQRQGVFIPAGGCDGSKGTDLRDHLQRGGCL